VNQQPTQNVQPAPQSNQIPMLEKINWEEHKESRDVINQQVPGGVASVDALLKILQQNQMQSS
jgi:hypothetical protein